MAGKQKNNGRGGLPALLDRLPPHDIEAECALLGSIFHVDGKNIPELRYMVAPADFYKPAHACIYEQLIGQYDDAGRIDIVMFKSRLESRGMLEDVGGLEYLIADLIDAVPSAAAAGHYAGIVRELSQRRRVADVATKMLKSVYGGDYKADEIAAATNRRMYELMDSGGSLASKITSVGEAANRVWEKAFTAKNTGVSPLMETGFWSIDHLIGGIGKGEVVVLAGATGAGKTSLAMSIAFNVAARGKSVAVFSMEMPDESLAARRMSTLSNIDVREMRKPTSMMLDNDWNQVYAAATQLHDVPLRFIDQPGATVQQIIDMATIVKMKWGLDFIVIDYLQLMNGPGKSTYERVSHNSQGIKNDVARRMNVPVMLLSQLSRNKEDGRKQRRYAGRVPQMSDLKESGSIENDADQVWLLYSDDYYRMRDDPSTFTRDYGCLLKADKVRMDAGFNVLLWFNPRRFEFRDWPTDEAKHPKPYWYTGVQVDPRCGDENPQTNIPY